MVLFFEGKMFNINGRQGIVKLQVLDARSLPLEIEKCSLIIYILPIVVYI